MIAAVPLLLAIGCRPAREPAPETLDELAPFLFASWEDPEAVALGFENLSEFLETEGRSERAREGYEVRMLTEAQVEGIERSPDHALEDCNAGAAGAESPFPIEAHAALLVRSDQLFNDPKSYALYERTLLEGDPEAFVRGEAPHVRTWNEIDKKGGFGVHIPYGMHKDYRWVDLGDDRRAILARSWVPSASCAEGGANCVNLSFSIDLFFSSDAETTVRLTTTWADITTVVDSVLSEEQLVKLLVDGMVAIFDNTDEHLAEASD